MPIDLSKFAGTLPYDSQLYGIYQPLLGWKSALQVSRLQYGLGWLRQHYLSTLRRFVANYTIQSAISDAPVFDLGIAKPSSSAQPQTISGLDALVTQQVVTAVVRAGWNNPDAWKTYTSPDFLTKALEGIHQPIKQEFLSTVQRWQRSSSIFGGHSAEAASSPNESILSSILQRESIAAGILAQLNQQYAPPDLQLVLRPVATVNVNLGAILKMLDPAQSDLAAVALSPIGVVHLFRQYFF